MTLEETNEIRARLGLKQISKGEADSTKKVPKEALSIEDTNKVRVSLGLKPIPNETVETVDLPKKPYFDEPQFIEGEKVRLLRDKLSKITRRNQERLGSRTLLDGSNDTSDRWLDNLGQSKDKKKTKSKIKLSYSDDATNDEVDDLPTLKLAHTIDHLGVGKGTILTLRESDILSDDANEGEGNDVLEDTSIQQAKEDKRNIELRQMNKERRRRKMNLAVGSKFIEKDEANEKEDGISTLVVGAENSVLEKDVSSKEEEHAGKIKVLFDNESESDSDTGDFKAIKIKKRKKKMDGPLMKRNKIKISPQIQKVTLIDEDLHRAEEEQEDENYSIPKLKNRTKKNDHRSHAENRTADDIAEEIRREKLENERRSKEISKLRSQPSSRIVIDESTMFLESMQVDNSGEEATVTTNEHDSTPANTDPSIKNPIIEAKTDSKPSQLVETSIDNSQGPDFSAGLASTYQFLQGHSIFKKTFESESKAPTMERSTLETQDGDLENYNPDVQLIYKDKDGHELTTKEAYKKLSQKFHGTKSNKRKLAKNRAKIMARNQKEKIEIPKNLFSKD